jgi:hypothetical protein
MRRLALLAVFFAASLSRHALAQTVGTAPETPSNPADGSPPPPSNATREAAAQALFDEGVKLMEDKRYPEACQRFSASQKLDPGAGTLLNLGTCYEKNGQTASAWATFKEAMSAAQVKGRSDWADMARQRAAALVEAASVAEKGGHPDWAARARERAAALEPRLARVTVAVPPEAAAEGLVVERDSLRVDAGSFGAAIPVDPGQYTFSASAPGKKKGWSTTVKVEAGGHATVTIPELENEPPPPPTRVAAPVSASFWSGTRVSGVAVGGAGVVALVVGTVLGLRAKSDYDDARTSDCPNGGTRCTPAGISLGQDATSLATASTVTFVVGGLALATGVTLFIVGRPHSREETTAFPLRVTPRIGRQGGGVGLEGAW